MGLSFQGREEVSHRAYGSGVSSCYNVRDFSYDAIRGFLFIIDPIAMDGEFLFLMFYFVFGLRPGEHLVKAFRK